MSAPQQPGYGQPGFNAPVQGKSRMVAGLGYLFALAVGFFGFACAIMTFMGKWIYAADANGVPTV